MRFNLTLERASLENKDSLHSEDTAITRSKRMTITHHLLCPEAHTVLQATCSVPAYPLPYATSGPGPYRGQAVGGGRLLVPATTLHWEFTLDRAQGRHLKTHDNP